VIQEHYGGAVSQTGAGVQPRPQPVPAHADSDHVAMQPYASPVCGIMVSSFVICVITCITFLTLVGWKVKLVGSADP